MEMKIALAGNPNCGKTTMFNDLTGSSQYVGNWPGVTVEKKEGKLKGHKGVIITDLPGVYSLSPYTLEEVVSRNYLVNERPDAIINLVDATNLERNLYLTTQILELGIPVVIALNMMDIVKKSGDKIDTEKLSRALGCAIVETTALKGAGSLDAAQKAINLVKNKQTLVPKHEFSKEVEQTLDSISELVQKLIPPDKTRWYAVKLFERDEKVLAALQLPQETMDKLETIIQSAEEKLDDDSETIITNERYDYIADVTEKCLQKGNKGSSVSDKIDRVVTNRIWALPIFAGIIFVIYYIAVSSVGKIATDFMNDTLFGDWVTNGATAGLKAIGAADWLQGLIVNGIIGGVGTVLGFVPQMLIVFFFLSFLEDCGYMARIAFIMDRIFRRFGLSGKSFIPILISSGCGVPGIMGTRTIESDKDRRMTIMITTFMPCSAKLIIISMMVATFFPNSFLMAPAMYFLGIGVIVFSGIVLKKTAPFSGDPAPFVMELPAYHLPSIKGVLIHMWERSRAFIIKAGTIIFVISAIVWFLSSYSIWLQPVDIAQSILAIIGHAIAWFFVPLGFGDWKGAVASINALTAKETAVSTLAVLSGVKDSGNDHAVIAGIQHMFTPMAGFSYMIFNLFNPPCMVAMSTTGREMGSAKWTAAAIGYQLALGYSLAFVCYQLGSVLFYGANFGFLTALAILVVAFGIYLLVRPARTPKSNLEHAAARA